MRKVKGYKTCYFRNNIWFNNHSKLMGSVMLFQFYRGGNRNSWTLLRSCVTAGGWMPGKSFTPKSVWLSSWGSFPYCKYILHRESEIAVCVYCSVLFSFLISQLLAKQISTLVLASLCLISLSVYRGLWEKLKQSSKYFANT